MQADAMPLRRATHRACASKKPATGGRVLGQLPVLACDFLLIAAYFVELPLPAARRVLRVSSIR